MWFGCGSDVVRTCFSDLVQTVWQEVKEKWFPAPHLPVGKKFLRFCLVQPGNLQFWLNADNPDPLNEWGGLSKTPCFIVLFELHPLIKGVNFHPLNYGGVGCQGS